MLNLRTVEPLSRPKVGRNGACRTRCKRRHRQSPFALQPATFNFSPPQRTLRHATDRKDVLRCAMWVRLGHKGRRRACSCVRSRARECQPPTIRAGPRGRTASMGSVQQEGTLKILVAYSSAAVAAVLLAFAVASSADAASAPSAATASKLQSFAPSIVDTVRCHRHRHCATKCTRHHGHRHCKRVCTWRCR